VKWVLGRAQLCPKPAERLRIVVGARKKSELILEAPKDERIDVALGFQTLSGAVAQAGEVAVPGDPDDRHRPVRIANQAGQGGEDLLESQIARGTEEDEGVGTI